MGAVLVQVGPLVPATQPYRRRDNVVDEIVVEDDGSIFRVGGRSVDLRQRKQLARIVEALASVHLRAPGEWISTPSLIDIAWRGERMQPTSAKNRLHVAICTLRRLGLQPVLQSRRGAYRIRSDVRVIVLPRFPGPPRVPRLDRCDNE
jgi:hypothetical protein